MNSIEELKSKLPMLNNHHLEKRFNLKRKKLVYFAAGRAKLAEDQCKKILDYVGITRSESPKVEPLTNNKLGEKVTSSELALYRSGHSPVINGQMIELLLDPIIQYNPVTGNAGTSKDDFQHLESTGDFADW